MLRDQIKAAQDCPISSPIPCPEWDCTLYIRTLEGGERDAFEESVLVKKGKKREVSLQDLRAKLVALSACDKDGRPAFQPGDEKWLTCKSGVVLDRLADAAMKHNKISDKDVEEMAGN